jgi:dihydroorotate dehydrogenase
MIEYLYKKILKPIMFLFPADHVHEVMVSTGQILGSNSFTRNITRKIFAYENKKYLSQEVLGLSFANPIGLSAGFDYEAKLTQILPDVGFGFMTVGSITWGSYDGNPRPMLGRLPKSKSLLVNKGLKSSGAKSVFDQIKSLEFKIPVGISIAKTNSVSCATEELGIKDYVESAKFWSKKNIAQYYEINISCPNAFGGEPFTTVQKLERLMKSLDKVNFKSPVFVKMPIELGWDKTKELLGVCVRHRVDGVIFGNLAKDRSNPALVKDELAKVGKGNFSGKPTWEKSNEMIAKTYKKYGKKLIIIGSGGVFSAKDAYTKIKLGATLVQMITGMIYEGPQVVGQINRGLVELLKKDGYKNISEAVGKDI